MPTVKVFIAYAHEDQKERNELVQYLSVPAMRQVFEVWHDGEIKPGEIWDNEIHHHLESAHIAILLISVHSLTSGYFWKKELPKITSMHRNGDIQVLPIILKPCPWEDTPELSQFQVLPENGEPLSAWPDKGKIMVFIATEVKKRAQEIQLKHQQSIEPIEGRIDSAIKKYDIEMALRVATELENLLKRWGGDPEKLEHWRNRIHEREKMAELRKMLSELEVAEKTADWLRAEPFLDRGAETFPPDQIAHSRYEGEIRILLKNISETSHRIKNRNRASDLDKMSENATQQKDFLSAIKLLREANDLDPTSERHQKILDYEKKHRDRAQIDDFERLLENHSENWSQNPAETVAKLEPAIRNLLDAKLDSSEEALRVAELLKNARQLLSKIQGEKAVRHFGELLKMADQAFAEEKYETAYNHLITASVMAPNQAHELEERISRSRLMHHVSLLRVAAEEFEARDEYLKVIGTHLGLLKLNKDDGQAENKIKALRGKIKANDDLYAQARATGERFLLAGDWTEAINYFSQAKTVKPDDDYVLERKNESERERKKEEIKNEAEKLWKSGKESFDASLWRRAKTQLSKSLRLEPANEEAQKRLDFTEKILSADWLCLTLFYGSAKRAFENLPPEIRELKFVQNRLELCEKRLAWWQKNRIWLFGGILFLFAAWLVFKNFDGENQQKEELDALFQNGKAEFVGKEFEKAKTTFWEGKKMAKLPADTLHFHKLETAAWHSAEGKNSEEKSKGKLLVEIEKAAEHFNSAVKMLGMDSTQNAEMIQTVLSCSLSMENLGKKIRAENTAELKKADDFKTLILKAQNHAQMGQESAALNFLETAKKHFLPEIRDYVVDEIANGKACLSRIVESMERETTRLSGENKARSDERADLKNDLILTASKKQRIQKLDGNINSINNQIRSAQATQKRAEKLLQNWL